MTKKLLVIIPDRLSALAQKGEVVDRYYNPENLFDEVHIMMINNDKPDVGLIQKMAGRAKLFLHNYPEPRGFFRKTLGWRPWLMNPWAQGAVRLAEQIGPNLIRCHGAHLNAFIASKIKEALGIPYIISLHINPDEDVRNHPKKEMSFKGNLVYKAQQSMEKYAIKNSNCVVCVYKFIEPYARSYGGKDVRVIYNVINSDGLIQKEDYAAKNGQFKAIIPGRQFIKKDPSIAINSLQKFKNLHLTLVGDGPDHDALKSLANKLNVMSRVTFLKSLSNEDLLKTLHTFDFLISINDYGGVSKVELEGAFVGMPIITNSHPKEDNPEILEENVITYHPSQESFERAIERMMSSEDYRKSIGVNLKESVRSLQGEFMEASYANLYKEYMKL